MGSLEVAGLALALGADCLSVCIGLGAEGTRAPGALRLAALCGLVQSALFLAGYQAAAAVHALLHIAGAAEGILGAWFGSLEEIHDGAHLVLSAAGAALLAVLGLSMIAPHFEPLPSLDRRVRRGRMGLLLVVATVNVDSFTAGLGLGMLEGVDLAAVLLLMSLFGGFTAWVGLAAGRRIGAAAGRFAQPLGGAILVCIAAKLLLVDLLG